MVRFRPDSDLDDDVELGEKVVRGCKWKEHRRHQPRLSGQRQTVSAFSTILHNHPAGAPSAEPWEYLWLW